MNPEDRIAPVIPRARTLAGFEPLQPAEAKILSGLGCGDFTRIGDGLPPDDDPARNVRAEFLRFLILGGAGFPLHEAGLRLHGAVVTGALDLEGCRIGRDIALTECRFDSSPILRSAIIDNLFLDGSSLPGLQADRLEARGGLSLCGAAVTGVLRLRGIRLGGNLEADGATITVPDGLAIDADGLEARGNVQLRGSDIRGGVDLVGARLGGDLNALGAHIERPGEVVINGGGIATRGDLVLRAATIAGEIRLVGAHFGGDADCSGAILSQPGGHALRLIRARIDGAFFLRQGASIKGTLDLTATVVSALDDDQACWPQKGDLRLNRCQYGAIIGGPIDAESRLIWLARQWSETSDAFWPQPYEHLANVFRDMGHGAEARAVLIAKEKLQRRARRRRTGNPLLRAALSFGDAVLAVTVRYGRQPLLAAVWLALFWVIGVLVFSVAERNGALKPNSPVILRSPEWTMCALEKSEERYMPSAGQVLAGRAMPGQSQMACFLDQPEASSYPEFHAGMYSLDVMLPVMEIGQKQYWRPDSLKPGGLAILNYYYFLSVIGWALSLLAIAGFSGLVKTK